MDKPVVRYTSLVKCEIGSPALVFANNHYNGLLGEGYRCTDGTLQRTSPVVSIKVRANGNSFRPEFWTENSHYVPFEMEVVR